MSSCRFEDYIHFLRDNIGNLIKYKQCTGTLKSDMLQIQDELFDKDPFAVLEASVKASELFAEENLYH